MKIERNEIMPKSFRIAKTLDKKIKKECEQLNLSENAFFNAVLNIYFNEKPRKDDSDGI
jgi:hypothetical protein